MKDRLLQAGIKVQKIIVFGSQANGSGKVGSDIDIMVISDDFKNKDIFKRVKINQRRRNYDY